MVTIPPTIALPLEMDDDGTIRVGHTRVLLELVIRAFQYGETPEDIVNSYPSLKLADVYASISYYLTHQSLIDEYIRQVDQEGEQIRLELEAAQSPKVAQLRARLRTSLEEKKRRGA